MNINYIIRATIVTNRITPILNLTNPDNRCAYKTKRFTADAIFYKRQQFVKSDIHGHISVDLSKAFDRVNRNKLRGILYGKGLPMTLIRNISQGRNGNIPHGKHEGQLGAHIHNNKVVFQGIPICALLYITFADGITSDYNQNIAP